MSTMGRGGVGQQGGAGNEAQDAHRHQARPLHTPSRVDVQDPQVNQRLAVSGAIEKVEDGGKDDDGHHRLQALENQLAEAPWNSDVHQHAGRAMAQRQCPADLAGNKEADDIQRPLQSACMRGSSLVNEGMCPGKYCPMVISRQHYVPSPFSLGCRQALRQPACSIWPGLVRCRRAGRPATPMSRRRMKTRVTCGHCPGPCARSSGRVGKDLLGGVVHGYLADRFITSTRLAHSGNVLHAVGDQQHGGAVSACGSPGSCPGCDPGPSGSRPAVGSSSTSTRGLHGHDAGDGDPALLAAGQLKGGLCSSSASPQADKLGPPRARGGRSPRRPAPCSWGRRRYPYRQVSSKSWYSGYWNTRPVRKRKSRIFSGSAHRSRPSMKILPLVGLFRPFIWVIRVLLPEPVAPMMPTKSPSSTSKLTSSSAVTAVGHTGIIDIAQVFCFDDRFPCSSARLTAAASYRAVCAFAGVDDAFGQGDAGLDAAHPAAQPPGAHPARRAPDRSRSG